MLVNKTYKLYKSNEFKIVDGISRKIRIIHKPKFSLDQIIHWSLIYIYPYINIEECKKIISLHDKKRMMDR